eukprot:5425931-Alexandrium_andersonii.AAC.1
MSASLVGSEMCIRDSSPLGPPASGPARAFRRASRAGPAGAGRRGAGSVSYTHLTLPTICSV